MTGRPTTDKTADEHQLDARRAVVLRAVVQQYIETSQPVSSSTVMERSGVTASSATVRSEMAALEREGFLQQPHTSAGRIPTDRGYRFFVDQLSDTGRLALAQQQDVREFFDKASGEIEHMLNETGRLLSKITGSAAVVVGPGNEAATIRSAQIVTLGDRVGLAVVVLSDGSVEKAHFRLPDCAPQDVVTASDEFNKLADGKMVAELHSSRPIVGDAIGAIVATMHDHNDNVYVGGASRLAEAFEAVEVVHNVLTILEQQFVVVNLVRDLLDRGVTVSIGNENKVVPLAQCSLVVAPTVVDGEARGSIAVLGPTRMDYSQAMAAVSVVSRNLGERLRSERLGSSG